QKVRDDTPGSDAGVHLAFGVVAVPKFDAPLVGKAGLSAWDHHLGGGASNHLPINQGPSPQGVRSNLKGFTAAGDGKAKSSQGRDKQSDRSYRIQEASSEMSSSAVPAFCEAAGVSS